MFSGFIHIAIITISFLFKGWIILHCTLILHYPVIHWWTFETFFFFNSLVISSSWYILRKISIFRFYYYRPEIKGLNFTPFSYKGEEVNYTAYFILFIILCFRLTLWLWDLNSLSRDWTWLLLLKPLSPNHWSTRELPVSHILMLTCMWSYKWSLL